MAQLCHWIATAEEEPSLANLAERAGMSPFHLQRVFKAAVGVSPKAYAKAQRRQRLQVALGDAHEAPRVIDAIFDAGFASTAQLYRDSQAVLGMTPRQYRTGGTAQHIRFGVGECSLGPILVAATEQGICAILLGDDADALVQDLQQRFPKAQLAGGDAAFERWMAQVIGFVDEPSRGLALPLDVRGTAFQQQVWQALRRIPVGSTVSYSELARTLGMPQASRAVAGACAANAIAVAIPCHRVVRSDGEISGYRWGVDRKRALLRHEAELAPQALRVARHG
jgi:AraC family transcriptional regulator of adaptative response/methylated-DNA-[protein]-cysteine methyltransferase